MWFGEYCRVKLAGIISEYTPKKPLPAHQQSMQEPTTSLTLKIAHETWSYVRTEAKRHNLTLSQYCRIILLDLELPNANQNIAQED